ncbi:MAG TPA: hypothetical protein VMT93_04545 [Gemmatimonadaceae bacterium]|nr:hypothetical protein [Gemmatimonadaceae bacterium]
MSSKPQAPAAAPRFAALWAALTYAAATLALGYPALAGKFLLTPVSDQYIGGYGVREFAAHALRTTGHFPMWNPYIFGGMPYVASMNGDMFYPTFLLRLVLPTDAAMTWSFMIHVFLAGFFTYLFLRAWGLGFFGALVGGLAYMMGGPIAAYVSPGHDGKLYVSALLPLALFLLLKGIRDGRRWSWGALAIVVGLAVLSPHPQLLQYMLLASGAFAIYLAFSPAIPGDRRAKLTRLGAAGGSVALGFLMGAVQYLPVIQYVPWSPRAGGLRGYDVATSYSFPPEELVNTYLPQFSGILDAYTGRNGIHFHSEYLGVTVLILATLGLASAGKGEKKRSFTWFWIGTWIVSLLWSLGGFTPFYQLVYALVPGTKFFRAPSTMMFVMAFSTAVLAALGAERAMAKQFTRQFIVGWGIAAWVVLLLGLTGALTSMSATFALGGRSELAMDNGPAIIRGAVRGALFAALLLGTLFALGKGRLAPMVAGGLLAALVGTDLWSIERMYWRFSEPASVLYASDAILDSLSRLDQPARVLAFGDGPGVAYHDPALEGDGLMPHRIRSVLGYHGNELRTYDLLTGKADGYRGLGSPQLWRLLNLRYVLSNITPSPIPGGTQLLGPVKNAAGSTTDLYQMPGDNPYAWVTTTVVKGTDDAVMATLQNPGFQPYMAALFDQSAPVDAVQLTKLPDSTGIKVRVTHYEPGKVTLALDRPAPAGAALVASENYYPGWIATVDGSPAPIGRADIALIGVALPAGAKNVELTFTSPAYDRGKAITLAALALGVLLALGGVAMDRRHADG